MENQIAQEIENQMAPVVAKGLIGMITSVMFPCISMAWGVIGYLK